MMKRSTADIIGKLLTKQSSKSLASPISRRLQAQREVPVGLIQRSVRNRERADTLSVPGSEFSLRSVVSASPVGGSELDAPTGGSGSYEEQFNTALMKLIAASGGKLHITSLKRSKEKQTELYNKAVKKYGKANAGKWAAPPGRSNHEFGLAGDLRGDLKWAHANAAKFGLLFPMKHEPWHIELPNAKKVRGTTPSGGNRQAPAKSSGKGGRPTSTGNPHLDYIIMNESRFDPNAQNPTSSAFGIGQMIRANRIAYGKRLGFDPNTTDSMQQIAMMMEYVKDRYGTPEKAAAFKRKHGWY